MTPSETFQLRMQTAAKGFHVFPCTAEGDPHISLWQATQPHSEGAIKQWGVDFPDALTAVYDPETDTLTTIDEVPTTKAEFEAQRRAEAAALLEAEKARRREQKAAKRRAAGALPRAEWLAQHSARPWETSGLSKWAWYRAKRKAATGSGNGVQK
jgi:hypothetical protein